MSCTVLLQHANEGARQRVMSSLRYTAAKWHGE